MQIVRRVTDAAKVVSASYRILVTMALGWYLVGELVEKGRHGVKSGPKNPGEKRVK